MTLLGSRLMGARYPYAAFVGSFPSGNTPASIGAVAGDLLVAMTNGPAPTSAGAGSWTQVVAQLYTKKATAADVAGPVSSGPPIAVFRGASALRVVRTNGASSASTVVTLNGFLESPDDAGLFAFENWTGGAGAGRIAITGSAAWPIEVDYQRSGPTGLRLSAYVRPSDRYVENRSFAWTVGGGDSNYSATLTVGELLF